jgi:hypothetical protein
VLFCCKCDRETAKCRPSESFMEDAWFQSQPVLFGIIVFLLYASGSQTKVLLRALRACIRIHTHTHTHRYVYEGGPKNNWNLNVARELKVVAQCAATCCESTQYSSSLPRGVSLGSVLLLLWLFFLSDC